MNAIIGLGPVALLVAALLDTAGEDYVFWARGGGRSRPIADKLASEGILIRADETCSILHESVVRGEISDLHGDLRPVKTLYLCTPHTEYESVVQSLPRHLYEELVLLNGGLGNSDSVAQSVDNKTRVFTFSNFFGAAKFHGERLHLKALKRKVYLCGETGLSLAMGLPKIGVEVGRVGTSLEAELRNITLYAHSAFGLAPHTLEAVFGLTDIPRYLYKLYPEGPVDRNRTRVYAQFFEDVMSVAEGLGARKFNLLEFLQRDNYPVSSRFLADEEVENYPKLSIEAKGDLLFARYCGLLVDASSQPDQDGRFFDFSAVRVAPARKCEEVLHLPRIQAEELYNLQILRALEARLGLELAGLREIWADVQSVIARLESKTAASLSAQLQQQNELASSKAASMVIPR